MRKFLVVSVLALAVAALGCAATQTREAKPITKGTKIKCPKCGVVFTVGEGLEAYEQGK